MRTRDLPWLELWTLSSLLDSLCWVCSWFDQLGLLQNQKQFGKISPFPETIAWVSGSSQKISFFFLSGFSRENMGFSRKFCNFLNLDGKLFLVDVAPRSLLLVGKLEIRGRSEEEISGHTRSLFRLFQSLIFYFVSNYLSKIILLIPEGKNKNRKGKKITTFLY